MRIHSLLLPPMLFLTGCTLVGAAAVLAKPLDKIPAQYKPTTRPMLVLVESYSLGGGGALLTPDELAGYLVSELRTHKVGGVIVDSTRVIDLRSKDPANFRKLTVRDIGQRLGAEQVLYVDLTLSDVSGPAGNTLLKGTIQANVKMVDVPTGRTLWPDNSQDGYPLALDTPYTKRDESVDIDRVREGLSRAAANRIAALFYTITLDD